MRLHGVVRTATGLGLHGHACWAFSDDQELRRGVADFLADGVELGQRMLYEGIGSVERLRADLRELEGIDDLIGGGGLHIISLGSLNDDEARTHADTVLNIYARETQRALADGFRGLRVAADATSLVLDEANWDDHVRWEAFADRYSALMPVAALCGYDRRRLPDSIVGDLACCTPRPALRSRSRRSGSLAAAPGRRCVSKASSTTSRRCASGGCSSSRCPTARTPCST